jgi:putative SOS response-associated peptidase YedK
MCGRFTLTADLEQIAERFSFRATQLALQPHYNIAPSQPVLTVIGAEERRAGFPRWGLIPSWAKDPSIGDRMINARAETLAEKPSFQRALQKRRCLVIADGFYEWQQEGKKKTPLYITLKSREVFGFAGLWESWKSPTGDTIHSCAIVTTAPNAFMTSIHQRMPVILSRAAEAQWLDRSIEDPARLLALLTPYADGEMSAYAVSSAVNSPRNDSPVCIEPVH